MFNPERLSLARHRRGFTKKSLAEAIGVDQKTIIRYENGLVVPPEHTLERLSLVLGFPAAFLNGPDFDEPTPEGTSFRGFSTMSARARDAALAGGALAYMVDDWIMRRFHLPAPSIPTIEFASPDTAALYVRQQWGLGVRPISNLVHLLESKGARVFSLAESTNAVDAFSTWRGDLPYVFLNQGKSSERGRFDGAHELGHLVMHRHGGPHQGISAEEQANQFASAFLMPEDDVRAVLPRVSALNQLIEAKKRWKVSVAALNYRLNKLRVTTEWQYRQFAVQISERGFHKEEPYGIAQERSVVWQKVFDHLRATRTTKHAIAAELAIPVQEIENLLFGLANMLSLEGSATTVGKSRATLRLVKNENTT
jgi:Zn-dependent peptidase ImmA (M78 family)/DNA-binding XRE family transcriptional regulator